jgi:hypothetical protein
MDERQELASSHGFAGKVELRTFASEALRGNLAGDPHVREARCTCSPAARARFPVLFVLAGFTGRGQQYLETHPWRLGIVALYDRSLARGEMEPAILVLPDAFTKLGGSQYVNSSYLGRYEDYVARELVSFVDASYPTRSGRRGVVGKSPAASARCTSRCAIPSCPSSRPRSAATAASNTATAPIARVPARPVPHGGDPRSSRRAPRAPRPDRRSPRGTGRSSRLATAERGEPARFDLPMDLDGRAHESGWNAGLN